MGKHMEWLIGIYLVIGIVKALSKLGRNPALQPLWMSTEKNPIKWSALFVIYAVAWPLQGK